MEFSFRGDGTRDAVYGSDYSSVVYGFRGAGQFDSRVLSGNPVQVYDAP